MAIGPRHERMDFRDLDLEVRGVYDASGNSLSRPTGVTVVSALPTLTATSGTLPTAAGSTVVADATTPTVSELLDAIVELRKTVDDLRTAVNALLA